METQTKYQKMLEMRDYRTRKALLKVKAIMTEAKTKIKDKESREAIQPALNILEQIKEK
jgi:hypothetical protein